MFYCKLLCFFLNCCHCLIWEKKNRVFTCIVFFFLSFFYIYENNISTASKNLWNSDYIVYVRNRKYMLEKNTEHVSRASNIIEITMILCSTFYILCPMKYCSFVYCFFLVILRPAFSSCFGVLFCLFVCVFVLL